MATSESYLIFDDTLCDHVGSLFEYVDRHYDHCDGAYLLAHNLVTSHYLSGAVRFPVEYELYRRYKDVTQWESFMAKHFPRQALPATAKARQKLHKQLNQELLKDPEFARLAQQFRTKIEIAQGLLTQAIEQGLPFTTVLMDSWYLSSELVQALAIAKKDWVSLLKRNRNLETSSFQLKDATRQPIVLPQAQIKVEDLVALIPQTAYRKIVQGSKDHWCFTICARIAGLGKVRLVISFENPQLTGTFAVLISNRTDWSANQILAKYLKRWPYAFGGAKPYETFYRDGKQLLGLDVYRTRTFDTIEAHWCLVFVAYSILHLDSLPLPSSTGKGKRPTTHSKTIGEACRQQAQALIEQLILFAHDRLEQGISAAEVFSRLFAKQRKEVSV